ncbi:hypothetical protein LV83_01431 [Algoriphagus yeomjeoni]|uniref:Secreted protein n=2 Tax=Algoriphagus yeomjeoni TaxID=291403 RepID=A0A327PM19_9BACT|nr:hypothetical protein LV83_01431 [Algoriphagus yeomjeoni]
MILKLGILSLGMMSMFLINPSKLEAQTMTCTLIPDSITYFPDGMVCALYDCPNDEIVQACNLPEVPVIGD